MMTAVAVAALAAGAGGAALATSASASSANTPSARPTAAPSAPAGTASPRPWAPGNRPAFPGPRGSFPPRRGGFPSGGFPGGGFPSGGFPGGGFFGAAGGVVHGQIVVPESGGSYQTLDIQVGKVTVISSSSITVRSADGYTRVYRVNSSTKVDAGQTSISSVKVGNQVSIVATVSGSTATVTRVIDLTLVGKGSFAPGWGHQPPSAPATPSAG